GDTEVPEILCQEADREQDCRAERWRLLRGAGRADQDAPRRRHHLSGDAGPHKRLDQVAGRVQDRMVRGSTVSQPAQPGSTAAHATGAWIGTMVQLEPSI